MGADRALISAAFKLGATKAGASVPNMEPLFKSSMLMQKQILDLAGNALENFRAKKEEAKIGRDAQLASWKKTMHRNYEKLFIGKESMPQKVIDAVDDKIRRLQDEFEAVNTYGKNDNVENEKARTRIGAELQKVINEAVNARTTFSNLGEGIKSWNDGAIKGDIKAMHRMWNLDTLDDDDNVSVSFVNGKLTFRVVNHLEGTITEEMGIGTVGDSYVHGDVSYNIDQMKDNVPMVNLDADAAVFTVLDSAYKEGKNKAVLGEESNFDISEAKRIIANQIQTKEDFQNLGLRRLDDVHEKSFETNLMENMEIVLSTMDVTFQDKFRHLDKNNGGEGDGIINEEDFQGLSEDSQNILNDNLEKMLSVLTNIDDLDFNLNRSKNLLVDYFADFANQRYEKAYNDNLPEDESSKSTKKSSKKGNYLLGGGELYNPIVGKSGGFKYAGWKYSKGVARFDDIGTSKKILKNQQVEDIWGNTYKPTMDTSNLTSMGDFGKKGYNVIDGGSGKLIKYTKQHEIDGIGSADQNGNLFYTIEQTQRNVTGLKPKPE